MRQRGNMIVSDIVRFFFQGAENGFKAGIVAASNRDAPEMFQESGKQSGGFRLGFLLESLESSAA